MRWLAPAAPVFAAEAAPSDSSTTPGEARFLTVDTPLGEVRIERHSIYHIVEKRQDARERYVRMALDTLTGPFEVWKVAFTDGTDRLAYIGAYETKRQMLVSVAYVDGRMLWNFMHTDARALNKHRHGELVYQRYSALLEQPKRAAQESSPLEVSA